MMNLKTTYLGIELKNPIMVGASNLVNKIENLKQLELAGASAIVFKSLFEEQIQLERLELEEGLSEYEERNAEMISLFPKIEHAGPQEHLINLKKAKQALSIPLIASLNCVNSTTWVEYAKLIEETGVNAIELNFYAVPREMDIDAKSIEDEQVEVVKAVVAAVKIPVSVKLSPFYTNPLQLIRRMDKAGAKGFVLFNRLFQPDISIVDDSFVNNFDLSHAEDYRLPLRFTGLLHGNIKGDICSSTGVYEGDDAIRLILAGSTAVQVVSAVYKNKTGQISRIITGIEDWMSSRNYTSLDDFRGRMSRQNTTDPYIYKRAQYIDILLNSDNIFKKYPMR